MEFAVLFLRGRPHSSVTGAGAELSRMDVTSRSGGM
jgi:hypothetical protein